jgi:catechol-2,3-dioxygenase
MSLFKNVNVVSLDVVDWEKAKKFYRELLGWPVAFSDDNAGWEEYGGEHEAHVSITLWRDPQTLPPKRGGTTLVCIMLSPLYLSNGSGMILSVVIRRHDGTAER